jgi:hypothetical protein
MKKLWILILVIGIGALTGTIDAQVGKTFPQVEVENLDGEVFTLPSHFSKTYTLVGIGTSKKAEEDLRTWQTPIYNKFIAKTGFMDEMYDVEICFLPLFTGASKAAKASVVKKLKENNESLVLDHVMIYAGSREPFEGIDADGKSEPVFVLLDEAGKILWTAKGSFRQAHLDRVEEILTR